jgi:lipopolysaccharide export system protein LptA
VKIFYLIALLLVADHGLLSAQTNTHAATQPTRSQTVITSTVVFFSNAARQVIYSGNVRVDDPQMKLTCEQLTADLPQSGGHINHLVALTNVVMDSVDEKGQTNHATSDMAIYDYHVQDGVTNETITLSGNAKAENAQVILYGEPILYNRATGSLTATNQHMIFRQTLNSPVVNTNAPVARTNVPTMAVQPTNLPAARTNFPPGTIQNIDLMTVPQSGPTTTH